MEILELQKHQKKKTVLKIQNSFIYENLKLFLTKQQQKQNVVYTYSRFSDAFCRFFPIIKETIRKIKKPPPQYINKIRNANATRKFI